MVQNVTIQLHVREEIWESFSGSCDDQWETFEEGSRENEAISMLIGQEWNAALKAVSQLGAKMEVKNRMILLNEDEGTV